jgi:hypothetical protein
MKVLAAVVLLSVALIFASAPNTDAPTGFDNNSNGMVDDATHQVDLAKFDDTETVADGLGPLYNAQSCRECHQNPTSGGTSQVAELRVGHQGPDHLFHNPDIPIAHGAEIITGRTLVNDRSICPNAAFPDTEIQEHVPNSENIHTTRISFRRSGRRFRRGGCRRNLGRTGSETMQEVPPQNLRAGYLRTDCRSCRTNRRWPVRLEGPARQPAVILRRCLSERNGHHHPPVPRRGYQALQHG